MTDPVRRPLPRGTRRLAAAATTACLAIAPAAVVASSDGAAATPAPPTFQRINIDTGVYFSGRLTCLMLEEDTRVIL